MRKLFRRYLPNHDTLQQHRWLRPFADNLLHPRLWHLNRHSAAGAVAVGLLCGLIPGPFQMLGAALVCVLLRVNLPLALFTTLYTNPLTIVPLYLLAFMIGRTLLGADAEFVPPPELGPDGWLAWIEALAAWLGHLGHPLLIGLPVLGGTLAVLGYLAVRAAWRAYLIRAWRQRARRRRG